jgi:diaminohydroxyphosphoribosylaminopyrimidine deaminase/5-amino-6-(5-phosphoribosylamino)uracil reductase
MPGKKRNCTEKIIASNIKRVVIGTTDPNPEMNTRGIERLKEAGVEIELGILEEEVKELIEPFEKFINTGIPFVICKWAMSCDGKIATRTGESQWISCEKSREFDHHLRNIYDAIMVGAGTIRKDNPRLTCRIEGGRNPTRIIIGGKEPFYGDLNIADIEESETVVAVEESYISLWMDKLGDTDIELVSVEGYNGNVDIKALLKLLGERNVMSVLVEGGSGILGNMFDERLVDKVYVFISPLIIGGEEGYTPVEGAGIERMQNSIRLNNIRYERFDDDIMLSGYPEWK